MRGPEIRYTFYQFVMFQPTPPLEAGHKGSGGWEAGTPLRTAAQGVQHEAGFIR